MLEALLIATYIALIYFSFPFIEFLCVLIFKSFNYKYEYVLCNPVQTMKTILERGTLLQTMLQSTSGADSFNARNSIKKILKQVTYLILRQNRETLDFRPHIDCFLEQHTQNIMDVINCHVNVSVVVLAQIQEALIQ